MKDLNTILIIAGEASGDIHGANLIREIKKQRPDLTFFGIGGDQMKSADVETIVHARDMSFLGFIEVLRHLPFIRRVYRSMVRLLDERKPGLVLLIDYPGFNLRFARAAKKRGIPVLYYISPQIWAWGKGRMKKIVRCVDRMLVIFPFEKVLYQKEGMDVHFVGHPLKDDVKTRITREAFFRELGLDSIKRTIGVLPGSRQQEVSSLLPDMIKALDRIRKELPDLQAVLGKAPTLDDEVYKDYSEIEGLNTSVRYKTYEVMGHSDVVMVASGTATLETAILGTPMLVLYKMSALSYIIGRALVRVKNIGLVNIIAGCEIVPELIQRDANAEKIAGNLLVFLTDDDRYRKVKEELKIVSRKLGEKGGSKQAAESVLDFINGLKMS